MSGHRRTDGLARLARLCAVLSVVAATTGTAQSLPPVVGAASLDSAASSTNSQISACALLSEAEISETVGSSVPAGEEFAGSEVCRWSNDQPPITSVLLTVRPAGSLREQVLCGDLRQGGGEGERLDGVADVALWRFSNVISLFNSGELETCGPKGYISLTLNGERDEATLKEAALALFGTAVSRV